MVTRWFNVVSIKMINPVSIRMRRNNILLSNIFRQKPNSPGIARSPMASYLRYIPY